jgi:hypothetical protein
MSTKPNNLAFVCYLYQMMAITIVASNNTYNHRHFIVIVQLILHGTRNADLLDLYHYPALRTRVTGPGCSNLFYYTEVKVLPHSLIKECSVFRRKLDKTYNSRARPTKTAPTLTTKSNKDPNNWATPTLANTKDHMTTQTNSKHGTPTPRRQRHAMALGVTHQSSADPG